MITKTKCSAGREGRVCARPHSHGAGRWEVRIGAQSRAERGRNLTEARKWQVKCPGCIARLRLGCKCPDAAVIVASSQSALQISLQKLEG